MVVVYVLCFIGRHRQLILLFSDPNIHAGSVQNLLYWIDFLFFLFIANVCDHWPFLLGSPWKPENNLKNVGNIVQCTVIYKNPRDDCHSINTNLVLMKLFQKHILYTRCDIYVFITSVKQLKHLSPNYISDVVIVVLHQLNRQFFIYIMARIS